MNELCLMLQKYASFCDRKSALLGSQPYRLQARTSLNSFLVAMAMIPFAGRAMEIQWTRMAGQWPVESSPLVGEFSQPGKTEILILNRGGQLMLWSPDGTAVGSGQDGLV